MGVGLGGNRGRTGVGTGSDWGERGRTVGNEGRTMGNGGRTVGNGGRTGRERGSDWAGMGVGLVGRTGGSDWSIRGGGQLIWPHSLPQMRPDRPPLREARACRVHGARRVL